MTTTTYRADAPDPRPHGDLPPGRPVNGKTPSKEGISQEEAADAGPRDRTGAWPWHGRLHRLTGRQACEPGASQRAWQALAGGGTDGAVCFLCGAPWPRYGSVYWPRAELGKRLHERSWVYALLLCGGCHAQPACEWRVEWTVEGYLRAEEAREAARPPLRLLSDGGNPALFRRGLRALQRRGAPCFLCEDGGRPTVADGVYVFDTPHDPDAQAVWDLYLLCSACADRPDRDRRIAAKMERQLTAEAEQEAREPGSAAAGREPCREV
jgi:hypothetical protein